MTWQTRTVRTHNMKDGKEKVEFLEVYINAENQVMAYREKPVTIAGHKNVQDLYKIAKEIVTAMTQPVIDCKRTN